MQVDKKAKKRFSLIMIVIVVLISIACMAIYPVVALNWARNDGIYQKPQDHIYAIAARNYCGLEKVVIEQAGPDAFDDSDPHIWYITYKIYASNHAPCDPDHPGKPMYYENYDQGGHFYLNVMDGWVMMPEGYFPIYIGHWMKFFKQAGPGM